MDKFGEIDERARFVSSFFEDVMAMLEPLGPSAYLRA